MQPWKSTCKHSVTPTSRTSRLSLHLTFSWIGFGRFTSPSNVCGVNRAANLALDNCRKMRDLTYKWSRDVEAIWRPETQMDSNTSPGQPSISPFVELKHATLGLDDGRSRTRRS